MKLQDFKTLAITTETSTVAWDATIKQLKELLADDMPELQDPAILHGIVGSIAAYTSIDLEEVAQMNMTMQEYTTISPALKDMESLTVNRALGAFARNLSIVMYKLGQQNAQPQPTSGNQREG